MKNQDILINRIQSILSRSWRTKNLFVAVLDQVTQGRQELTHGGNAGWWVFVAAEVRQRPRDVPQKRGRGVGFYERQKWLNYASVYNVITQLGSITC